MSHRKLGIVSAIILALFRVNSAFAQLKADAYLVALEKSGKISLASRLRKKIIRLRRQIDQSNEKNTKSPFILVGRVVIDDPDMDPRKIQSQISLDEEGYFATAVADHVGPIEFFRNGFSRAFVQTKDLPKDDPALAGEIRLKKLKPEEFATFHGRIDGIADANQARLVLRPDIRRNSLGNGIEPDNRYEPMELKVDVHGDGGFAAGHLTPGDYSLWEAVPGYYPKTIEVHLETGQDSEVHLPKLTLE